MDLFKGVYKPNYYPIYVIDKLWLKDWKKYLSDKNIVSIPPISTSKCICEHGNSFFDVKTAMSRV